MTVSPGISSSPMTSFSHSIVVDENGKRYHFKISGSEKGDYILGAKDEDEMNEWIHMMNLYIERFLFRKVVVFVLNFRCRSKNGKMMLFEKQGYLIKKGKRRFFRLSNGNLMWFLSEKEAVFKGSFNLLGCVVDLKDQDPTTLVVKGSSKTVELTGKRFCTLYRKY
jgi:hypothetical protein